MTGAKFLRGRGRSVTGREGTAVTGGGVALTGAEGATRTEKARATVAASGRGRPARRIWPALVLVLLAGCGVRPSGVTDGGQAPTGVAPGVTLYFVDAHGRLRPQLRETGRLGSVSEALALLLHGPGGSSLHTEIASGGTTQVVVVDTPGVVRLRVPLTPHDVTALGIDQIVCTTLGVQRQAGGPSSTKVRVDFTLPAPGSDEGRNCPLPDQGR